MATESDLEKKDLGLRTLDHGLSPRSSDIEMHHGAISEVEIDYVAEKKLIRKIDLNLITLFGALYLMSFLDKYQTAVKYYSS